MCKGFVFYTVIKGAADHADLITAFSFFFFPANLVQDGDIKLKISSLFGSNYTNLKVLTKVSEIMLVGMSVKGRPLKLISYFSVLWFTR